jgi:hypothetical protein
MSAGLLAPFKRGRDLLCSWFSLTRSEAGSLLLIFAVLLIGLAARAFL